MKSKEFVQPASISSLHSINQRFDSLAWNLGGADIPSIDEDNKILNLAWDHAFVANVVKHDYCASGQFFICKLKLYKFLEVKHSDWPEILVPVSKVEQPTLQ